MPLVSVLPILRPLLLALGAMFSQPQRRHFDNYIQSLICQDHRRTLAGMSRHVVDGPDASSWDRFVTAAPWELPALNTQWRGLLRKELRQWQPIGLRIAGKQTDFLIFDDTQHPYMMKSSRGPEMPTGKSARSDRRQSFHHPFVMR